MPFADYKDFADCVAKNQDKDNPEAYCGKIKHQVEDSKSETKFELKEASEQKYEIKDPRGDGAVLDDRGQPNIIDYSNQEPMLYQIGENSSHKYPGKIVITNESRYVDREVKRSNIPNVAATGKDATGADKTQPTLPTGAPFPDHNLHGMNFNNPVDWNKQEVVSIGSGLVARQIGTGKKKEGGPGSGRLSKLAGKISAHAPIVAAQLVNLATQIPLEGVDQEDRKEMVESIMKDELRILVEAVFVEQEHPRGQPDNPGQFVTKGGEQVTKDKEPEISTTAKKDVYDVKSYNSNDGKIFINVEKVIPDYERHIDHIRDIWNEIPSEDKIGITRFSIGDPPISSPNAIGSFNTGTNVLGIHLSNANVSEKSTDKEIREYLAAVLIHEVAHSKYHKLSNDEKYDWEKEVLSISPITKYLSKFKEQLIEARQDLDVQEKRRDNQFAIIDANQKKIQSGVSSLEASELKSDIKFREKVIEEFSDAYETTRRRYDRTVDAFANETHSEFQVLNKGHFTLWDPNIESFNKIKPIYQKLFGGT